MAPAGDADQPADATPRGPRAQVMEAEAPLPVDLAASQTSAAATASSGKQCVSACEEILDGQWTVSVGDKEILDADKEIH